MAHFFDDVREMMTSRVLMLDLPEFKELAAVFDLPPANTISPLPALCQGKVRGDVRPVREMLKTVPGLTRDGLVTSLAPMLNPDRVIDAWGALFNSAPSNIRLYQSALEPHLVGMRLGSSHDRELFFPLDEENIKGWLFFNLQYGGRLIQPTPFDNFSGDQLAFLLALIDAFKCSYFTSFGERKARPEPVALRISDIMQADAEARQGEDRRFLVTAFNEFLRHQVHVGGLTRVGLPQLTLERVKVEVGRYFRAGYLGLGEKNEEFTLNPRLIQMAGDLAQWISILSLHDCQVTDTRGEKPGAVEEALFFISTQSTIWGMVTDGLTRAGEDLAEVNFGLRSLTIDSSLGLASDFLRPVENRAIAPEFYEGKRTLIDDEIFDAFLDDPDLVPEAGRDVFPMETVICPRCGAEVLSSARFCGYCGAPMARPD